MPLVLTTAIGVAGLANLIGFEEQHLSNALVGVDLRWQRCSVGKFERHMASPLRLKRCHVDDDAAPRVGGLAETNRQHISWNAKVFNGPRQSERVGWYHANITFNVNERIVIERLGVNRCRIDIREDLELARASDIVAVT